MTKRESLLKKVRNEIDRLTVASESYEWDARTSSSAENATFYDGKADTFVDLAENLSKFEYFLIDRSDENASFQKFYIEGMMDAVESYKRSLKRILNELEKEEDYEE